MKTKKNWYIAACILLVMIMAVVCICWAVNGGSYSKTASPTALATTTTITTSTLLTPVSSVNTMSTVSTTIATTELTATSTTRTKTLISTASIKYAATQSPCSHQYYRPRDNYVYNSRLYWFSTCNEETWGVIPPTCTDKGFTVQICSTCKHEKFEDYVPATGHNLSKELEYVYPGYQKEGYSYSACADCDAVEIVEKFPARKGNLSGIASTVKHSREVYGTETRCDFYTYNIDGTYIRVSDLRTWGYMPKITVHSDEGFLQIEYDLVDGTIVSERIYFPGENLFYSGSINRNGNLEGAYRTPFQ